MKFVRFGEPGAERPGFLDAEGRIRDLSDQLPDLAGDVLGRLDQIAPEGPLVEGTPRLGPPVGGIGKVVCIGEGFLMRVAA